jgi:DNA-directed RNA polymerase subunit RPC12/RpoP
MQNYTGFELGELNRVGVVCQDCGTEVVFDISKTRAADPDQRCPGCGDREFMTGLNPFGTKPFVVPDVFRTLQGLKIKSVVRLYFKAGTSA